jgi:hydrogenase maturation protease
MNPAVTARPRILVAGIGNIFLGDDAFGVEVLRRLLQQPLPPGVEAIDFGIRGFDLACSILDGYDAVILVDATPRGGPPGTLYVLEPEMDLLAADQPEPALEGHALTPARVLQWVQALGGPLPTVRIVGCEPATFDAAEQTPLCLSPAVAAAVDRAVDVLNSLVEELACEPASVLIRRSQPQS